MLPPRYFVSHVPVGAPDNSTLIPIAFMFACTFWASVVNGTPLIVRSLGYSSVTVWEPCPDAESADFALVTFCLSASFAGNAPRNIDGMIPGVWYAPGPATERIDL